MRRISALGWKTAALGAALTLGAAALAQQGGSTSTPSTTTPTTTPAPGTTTPGTPAPSSSPATPSTATPPSPVETCGLAAPTGQQPASGATGTAGGTQTGTGMGNTATGTGAGGTTTGTTTPGTGAGSTNTGTGTGAATPGNTNSGSATPGTGTGTGTGSTNTGNNAGTANPGTATGTTNTGTSTGTPAGTAAQANSVNSCFVQQAAMSGLFEVQSSQLANQQASNAKVKSFAQRMIQDHTKANQQLQSAAKTLSITVPTSLSSAQSKILQTLRDPRGGNFDRAYIAAQVVAHEQAVNLFNDYIRWSLRTNGNARLRSFATQTLPVLRDHLQSARDLQKALAQ